MRIHRQQVFLVLIGLFFVLLIDSALFFHNIQLIIRSDQNSKKTQAALTNFDALSAALKDEERNQRNYLITHNPAYLADYTSSLHNTSDQIAQLSQHFTDNPDKKATFDQLVEKVNFRTEMLNQVLNTFEQAGREAAFQKITQGDGKKRMDSVTVFLNSIKADEQHELEIENSQYEASIQQTELTFIALSVAGLLLLISAAVLFRNALAQKREIQRREEKIGVLINASIIGIIVADMTGKILDANQAFLDMLGYTEAELLSGKIWWQTISIDEFEKLKDEKREELRKNGQTLPFEQDYLCKNGKVISTIVGAAMLDTVRNEVVCFIIDITSVKELEKRKQEFLSIASHELKTPLTTIQAYSQLLEKQLMKINDQKSLFYAQKVRNYVQKLAGLIGDLLDISKIDSGKINLNISAFNFDEFITECINNIQPTTTNHVILLKGKTDQIIHGDPVRMEQVVNNLLINAIKYSPKGGKIEVRLRKEPKQIVCSIRDQGIGIPPGKQKKIFEKFYRASEVDQGFSGLGIGLFLASDIIQRHYGKIWVESKKGKGSTFFFSLPIDE